MYLRQYAYKSTMISMIGISIYVVSCQCVDKRKVLMVGTFIYSWHTTVGVMYSILITITVTAHAL